MNSVRDSAVRRVFSRLRPQRPARGRRWTLPAAVIALGAAAGCGTVGLWPERDGPRVAADAGPGCAAWLAGAVSATPVAFTPSRAECAIPPPVRASRLSTGLSQPMLADCDLMATFDGFLADIVQPAARRHLGQPVATTLVGPGHQCRRIYHRSSGNWSGHASGRAVDVRGFKLANGEDVILKRDWTRGDGRARFLRAVRDGACRRFAMTLGPEYNAAHTDHFHFEIDAFRICQ